MKNYIVMMKSKFIIKWTELAVCKTMQEADFKKYLKNETGVFVDVKGIFKNKISDLEYWSL
jgi:hypothetical protein